MTHQSPACDPQRLVDLIAVQMYYESKDGRASDAPRYGARREPSPEHPQATDG